MRISKNGILIETIEDWERHAAPKSKIQWVFGRSAMEVARAWLLGGPSGLPPEVSAVIESSADFAPLEDWSAEPEVKLPFDKFRGEPRNSDLVVWARDTNGPYVIAVEAKADEPFGKTVGEVLQDSLEVRIENPRSNAFMRVEQLTRALLPPRVKESPAVTDLRYQLLTACAGVLGEAERRGCRRAVMLVHEFITCKTADEKHGANAMDLAKFLCRISSGAESVVVPGILYGPYFVPGSPLFSARTAFYLGKVQRNLRSSGV